MVGLVGFSGNSSHKLNPRQRFLDLPAAWTVESFVTHNGKGPSDQTLRFVFLKIVTKMLGQIFGGPNNPWIWGSGNELEFVVENVFLLETFACG